MLSNLNQRANNVGATIDGHNQRQDFRDKRQVARLKKNGTSAGTETIYARILWNFVGGSDLCACQLVDDAGADLSPTQLGWIAGDVSIANVQPEVFGDVFYEVEDTGGTDTRSAVTRTLYNAVRYAGLVTASGGAIRMTEIERASTSTTGYPATIGTRIQTTINGSATDNCLRFYPPVSGAAGNTWDCALPPKYFNVGTTLWYVISDIQQTSRRRSGRAIIAAAGTISGLSIDLGESFRLFITAAVSGNTGTTQSVATYSVADLSIYSTASGTPVISGVTSGSGIGVKVSITAATASSNTASTVTTTTFNMTTGTVAPSVGTTSVTLTLTYDATTAKITSIAVAIGTGSVTMIVDGGQPVWQGVSGVL